MKQIMKIISQHYWSIKLFLNHHKTILREMKVQGLKHPSVGILLAAVLTSIFWLYEITTVIGWDNFNWLTSEFYAPIVFCLLVTTAYLTPFLWYHRSIDAKVVLTCGSLLSVNFVSLLCGGLAIHYANAAEGQIDLMAIFAILGILLFSFGNYWITDQLILKLRPFVIFLFLGVAVISLLLGRLMVSVFKGFAHYPSMLDAVKMGYPQFWLCLLSGILAVFIVKAFEE
jgi:hypothetical protein